MKAIVYTRYGSPDVLSLQDVERPRLNAGDVLVRVRGAAVNPYDWHFMRGDPYAMRLMSGLRAPKRQRLGVDFSGVVEEVAPDVTAVAPGDEVYGLSDGAFAEYVCPAAAHIALKPRTLDVEHAAAVPLAGLTALQGLRDVGRVQHGGRVLIVGASGGVGTFAVQLAKHFGAHVTGVCSTSNLDLVRSLGADATIDYTREPVPPTDERYDVIFTLGGQHSPAHYRRALTRHGRLVLSNGDSDGRWLGPLTRVLHAAVLSPFVSQTLAPLTLQRSKDDLELLAALIDEGTLKPVIDRTYPLGETAEAVRHVEQGHACGKVLIQL